MKEFERIGKDLIKLFDELDSIDNSELSIEEWLQKQKDFPRVWKLVKKQRIINKITKLISYKFSYHEMYMAVANLARVDSIQFSDPGTKKVWLNRYWKLRDHLKDYSIWRTR